MKYLIVTDIHGGLLGTQFILDEYKKNNYDKLICLGDVLYHGPRNDLPSDYNPKEVIKLLNSISNDIIWVRGNCDAEVDEMVLNFKVFEELDMDINGYSTHIFHGHHRDLYKEHPNVVLYGHTHIPDCHIDLYNTLWLNPGSITLPKENSTKNYIIWEDNKICCKSIDGKMIFEKVLEKRK